MNTCLVPADQYTVEQLANIYNQTRVDYMIPMPMNSDRLADYIHDFDIDLHHSVVAIIDGQVSGLGMLGLRNNHSWVTRLGVLPNNRRVGIGDTIMKKMLNASQSIGLKSVILEVIKGNERAWSLFKKHGFEESGEYLVLRRAPGLGRTDASLIEKMTWLDKDRALQCLRSAPRQTWINDFSSMANADDVQGLSLNLDDGSCGWLVFRKKIPTLTHIVLHTERGNPEIVGGCLLRQLHFLHPRFDTYAENIHCSDPHLPVYLSMGYFEAFRRTEMIREL